MKTLFILLIMLSGRIASGGPNPMGYKDTIKKLYIETINSGKLQDLDKFFSPAYLGPNGEKGPEGFAVVVSNLKKAFPDLRFEIEELVAEGDTVVVRWIWTATHEGPFAGIEATHKKVRNQGVAFYKFKDDKIFSSTLLTDRLAVLQDIGVVPKSFGPPAKK